MIPTIHLTIRVQAPHPHAVLHPGDVLTVVGVATGIPGAEPVSIDTVTVELTGPPIDATVTVVPHQPVPTVRFEAALTVPSAEGNQRLRVVAVADNQADVKADVAVIIQRPAVSLHRPDGMILSTANLYFTSHDALGAHVFRTAQSFSPGQEAELYREPPGNRFGDMVFANVGGVFYGYFFAMDCNGQVFIKRVPLTGSPDATVLTPPLPDIDIDNSHHNLATDGVSLYWQDVASIKKVPIGGGDAGSITTLDHATPDTPTAGVYLRGTTIVYASVAAVRFVPTSGTMTDPLTRTIANADTTVTTILPVADGTYWGDRNGAIQLELGGATHTIQADTGLIPTSLGTSGPTAGGALVWTQCASSNCQLRLDSHFGDIALPVGDHALGASMNSSGHVFWGDDFGVHRLVL